MDYQDVLRRRNERWRQAMLDRGLEPEAEKEAEIRRSHAREAGRKFPLDAPAPRFWLSLIRGRRLR